MATKGVNSDKFKAYFTNMEKTSDLSYSKYLHIAHDIDALHKSEERIKDRGIKDRGINLSDFLPEPKFLSQEKNRETP